MPATSIAGRQRELSLIEHWRSTASAGQLGVALLSGEPGIGKTQLLRSAEQAAAQAGLLVLRGGAFDAEGMPPYLPFLEALGGYIQVADPQTLREQVGVYATVLGTILPELVMRLGQIPASYALPPEQARLRLYEAIGVFLSAIAAPGGLLLVLDDLQWADPATLDLLCYIARQQPAARLLILGALRSGEAEQNSACARAIAQLQRLRVLQTLNIGPLAAEELGLLAQAYLGGPVAPALTTQLHTQSEGNPFFAEELLRGWLETGVLCQDGEPRHGRRQWTMRTPAADALPASIIAAVRQRLGRLPPATVELLRTAAIIGRSFEVDLLAEIAGQDAELVEEQLRQACAAHLLRRDDPGAYSFSHDKTRECLYDELTSARCQRLHGLIGSALDVRPQPAGARRLAELAFHFVRSGDRARGVDYAQQAAEAALHTYAFDEALAHLRAAAALVAPADQRRGRLLARLGQAALLSGAEREAIAAFEAAQLWFEQAGDTVAAARAAHQRGQAWWQLEAIPEALAAFEHARALLAGQPLPETVAVLVDLSSLLVLSLHRHAEGLPYASQALELARRLHDDAQIAAASRALGDLLGRSGDLPGGIALLEQALALAMASDDPAEVARCCACLRMLCVWHTEGQRALTYADLEVRCALRCHAPFLLRHVYTNLAVGYMFTGQLAEAERVLSAARTLLERSAIPEAEAYLSFVQGTFGWWRGDYPAAEEQLRKAISGFRALNPSSVVWYQGVLALVLALQGRRKEARGCIDELQALVAGLPSSPVLAHALSYSAATALLLDDRERLRLLYPRLLPFRGLWFDRLVDRLLGEIETREGDFEGAERSLDAAEATARREQLRWELAYVLLARARLVLARGGRGSAAQARTLLGEAQSLLRLWGNQPELRRVQELLRQLPAQRGSSTQACYPAGLSRREVEVLQLVAAGKSNREIAALLTLSEKTVGNHLTRIFAKIDVENRAAAAAFAIRHQLA